MTIQGVILDVDGTLVDSNEAHVQAWVRSMAEHGYQVPAERVRKLVGMGGDNLLPAAIGVEKESARGKEIDRRRKEILRSEYLPRLEALPGTRDLLEHLRERGFKLVVASSAPSDELETLLKLAGADDLIEEQTSSSDAERSKPDPDIVQAALESSGLAPDAVLMLGDTPYDIQSAGRAGVRVIALRSGGFSDEELAGAVAIYDDPADLLANYDGSPLGGQEPAQHVRRGTLANEAMGDRPPTGARTTTDHEEIRRWVSQRNGAPAMVRRVGQPDEGSLTINFPRDGSDEPIVDISWADFFQRFEDQGLALEYEESDTAAQTLPFYRLVEREAGGGRDQFGER